MNRKIIIGIGIGCGVLCFASVIVAVIAGGALINWLNQEPENINIKIVSPLQVKNNDLVMIQVQVENTAANPQTLEYIDLSSDYLIGIAINEVEPTYVESYHDSLFDIQSYTFDQEIPPRSTLVVQFFGIAVKAGDFSGNIDVCMSGGGICTSNTIRTIVEN